ncbi:MAG: hypothetical protein IKW12_01835 [Clostridia bacterium]|nr:hypothetical protein [Clostridia bacterium]
MKYKRLIISLAVTALEFVIFLVWGLNMNGGDEMGFGLITTYFLFPVTTLILSAYLSHENIFYIIPFTVIMFAAQNFMPFFVFGSFELLLILGFTLIPAFIGTLAGMGIKKLKK